MLKPHDGNLFLIGGVVRCLILKKKISSPPDLVTDLPIELVVKILKKQKIKISLVGIECLPEDPRVVVQVGQSFYFGYSFGEWLEELP